MISAFAFLMIGCGSGQGTGAADPVATPLSSNSADQRALEHRLSEIDDAVSRWQAAVDLVAVGAAAEAARNLVVGPDGPGYGDADGDGTVTGANAVGLLPGLAGQHGPATEAAGAAGACVVRDVLGWSWGDPSARWAILADAIAAWSPASNTFPSLPSHPQRIVGWATLALGADDLPTALEFGGHARLHIDIASRAVTDCG
ncbi:MAG: hypothetical protein E4H24_02245 [Thermomicrobiales bacterium]|nr:MAG: hypothetical protein E4H24_02245 [Thermomicrobiales bacterium]